MSHPAHVTSCPHLGRCSAALGCHEGTVDRGDARYLDERDGRFFALTWSGPRGPLHEAAPGDAPELDRIPLWVERDRVVASLRGDGSMLLDVVLDEVAAAGAAGVRGGRDGRGLLVVVLGLEAAGILALNDRIRGRVTAAAGVRVRRGKPS